MGGKPFYGRQFAPQNGQPRFQAAGIPETLELARSLRPDIP